MIDAVYVRDIRLMVIQKLAHATLGFRRVNNLCGHRELLHHTVVITELDLFHEVFREVVGTTPHQFLLQARLNQAINLLASTSLSVSEISYRVGFSSQSALTNALRKHKGTTPTRLQARDSVA